MIADATHPSSIAIYAAERRLADHLARRHPWFTGSRSGVDREAARPVIHVYAKRGAAGAAMDWAAGQGGSWEGWPVVVGIAGAAN